MDFNSLKEHKQLHTGVMWLIILAVFVVKLFYLDARSLGGDEPFTVYYSQYKWHEVLSLPYALGEPNPPLFMFLLHIWSGVFGVSLFALRLLPMLISLVTISFVYRIAYKLNGIIAAAAASFIFILSNPHQYLSLEVRTYSLLILGCTMTLYYILRLLDNPTSKKHTYYLLAANLIMVYSHYLGFYVCMAEFFVAVLYLKNKDFFKRVFLTLVATVVLYTPMWIIFIKQFTKYASQESWVPKPTFSFGVKIFNFYVQSEVALIFSAIMVLVLIIAKLRDKDFIKPYLIVLSFFLIPYIAIFFVSFKMPMFTIKYVAFTTPPLFICMGVALTAFFTKRKWIPITMAGVVIYLMAVKFYWIGMLHQEYKADLATAFVKKEMEKDPENTMMLILPHWFEKGFAYYYDIDMIKDPKSITRKLNEMNVYQCWGHEDFIAKAKDKKPERLLFYEETNGSAKHSVRHIKEFLKKDYVQVKEYNKARPFSIEVYERKPVADTISVAATVK